MNGVTTVTYKSQSPLALSFIAKLDIHELDKRQIENETNVSMPVY